MRKIVFVLFALLFALPLPCQAQRLRGIEVFGGYSYLRNNIGSFVTFPGNPSVLPSNDVGLNGWQASLTENTTNWFGVTEEFSGYYGSPYSQLPNTNFSVFSVLGGPRLSYPHSKRFTPFAHTLFGYGQTRATTVSTVTDSSFAFALGGGLDVKLTKHLGIRLFQADYCHLASFGTAKNHLRISAGVVFRFGR